VRSKKQQYDRQKCHGWSTKQSSLPHIVEGTNQNSAEGDPPKNGRHIPLSKLYQMSATAVLTHTSAGDWHKQLLPPDPWYLKNRPANYLRKKTATAIKSCSTSAF